MTFREIAVDHVTLFSEQFGEPRIPRFCSSWAPWRQACGGQKISAGNSPAAEGR